MPARMLAVLVLSCAGLVAVLLAIEAPARVAPTPSAATPPAAPESGGAPALEVAVTEHLMSPANAAALPLRRHAKLGPAALCGTIGLGADATGWVESPVFPGEWECLSRTPAKTGDGGFSLFAMARGRSADDIRYIRFKLSAPNAAEAEAGADLLALRLAGLFDALGWALADDVPPSIRRLQPFEVDDAGTTIRLAKEASDEARYNLTLTFPNGTMDAAADYRALIPSDPRQKPRPWK